MNVHLVTGAAIVVLALVPAGLPLAAQPVITGVQNNYSYILPNLPNYGIAPGSLFIIVGTGLAIPGSQASPLQDPSKALPQKLNGASVSVTVDGVPGPDGATTVTTQPALYYATPTAIAAVLPSSTPVGTQVTVTVTYGGATSQPYDTIVAKSAFGFDTYYGSGSGMAAVTDNGDGHLITPNNSAKPGETIVFWGSGAGADTNNDDLDPPVSFDNLNYITQLFIGGVQVPIVYQGRSHYQGVDQIDVTLPQNVPTGCAVSVVAVSGAGSSALLSNTVTLPIAANGGPCSDPLQPIGSAEAATLAGHALVKFGFLSLAQTTDTAGISKTASAQFASILGTSLFAYLDNALPSLGSCVVYQQPTEPPPLNNPFNLQGLLPGTILVTGPNGTQALNTVASGPGLYTGTFTSGFIPPTGGPFTFAGQGGSDVEAFNAPLNFPNPLFWTNESAASAITRSQGVTVNWTGGDPDTYVQITGSATTVGVTVSFTCDAPVSPATFTVPAAVLLALPAASGGIAVGNFTLPNSFSATGLDFGFAASHVSVFEPTTYQ
ncbi:MAG TPA: hypothetical protein VGE89_08585 [Bryobacteraceae bacterium]|jgi:uncharacterized protein (TIGR03437 family)